MLIRTKKNILKWTEEEFIKTTDTLWENEIQANITVSHILIGTSFIALIALVAQYFDLIGFGTDPSHARTR